MDVPEVNQKLIQQNPEKIIMWAADTFGAGLVMSSSFGAESALLISIATKIVPTIPVIFIDTGYLFPETYQFAADLSKRYRLNLKIYGATMSPKAMEEKHGKLWEQGEMGLKEYHRIRKIEPMNRALHELGVTALISGVRADQTKNRAGLLPIMAERDGIFKIHPLLSWSQMKVTTYFKEYDLPYHPLVAQGYESIGDTHTTLPGKGRSGRQLGASMECGLHILEKELV